MSVWVTINRQPLAVSVERNPLELTIERRTLEVQIVPSQGPPGPAGPKGDKGDAGDAAANWTDQHFTPTDGQTEFILSAVPKSNASVFLIINSAVYLPGEDFTVSGVTLGWQNAFQIQAGDEVIARYLV